MDLSYTFECSKGLASLSPNGLYVASAHKHILHVRTADIHASENNIQKHTAADIIYYIEWSPDSNYVLVSLNSRSKVQVFSIRDRLFECTFDQGGLGLSHARWLQTRPKTKVAQPLDMHDTSTPHMPLYVAIFSSHNLFTSVWSLATQACAHVANPKFTRQAFDSCTLPLSSDEYYKVAAMATRHNGTDYVCVFPYDNPDDFRLPVHSHVKTNINEALDSKDRRGMTTRREEASAGVGDGIGIGVEFTIADLTDLGGLEWSPLMDGTLCVWDSCLGHTVSLYSLEGEKLGSVDVRRQSTKEQNSACVGRKDQIEDGQSLGVKCVQWAPDGSMVAVGTYDGSLTVINTLTWKRLWAVKHNGEYSGAEAFIFIEEKVREDNQPPKRRYRTHTEEYELTKMMVDESSPTTGVGMISISPDSRFLASRCDDKANALCVWSIESFELVAVLIQLEPILHFSWRPHRGCVELAVSTGTGHVYMWSPEGTSVITLEIDSDSKGFCCKRFLWGEWNADVHMATGDGGGNNAIAMDTNRFIVCQLDPPVLKANLHMEEESDGEDEY
eukprot:CFRG2208T1